MIMEFDKKFKRRYNELEEYVKNCYTYRYPCDYDSSSIFIKSILKEILEIIEEGEDDGIYISEWLDYETAKKYVIEMMYEDLVNYYFESCGEDNINLEEELNRIQEMMYFKLNIINEEYDKNKLYSYKKIVTGLTKKNNKGEFIAPKSIRDYVEKLEQIECIGPDEEITICTKIPEVIYIYLMNRY